MLFSQSLLVFFLSAGSALAGPISSHPASSVPADDGPSSIRTLSSTSSKIQCHTRLATTSVDPIPSSTSTIFKTKHAKHSVSRVTPDAITIYKDAVTSVVATRTRWFTETITDSTLTDVFSTTTTVTDEALSTEWATETSTSTAIETVTAGQEHKREFDGLKKRAKQRFPVSVTCRETLAVQTTYVKIRTTKPSKTTIAASTRSVTRTIKSTTTSTIVPGHISSTATFTDTTTTTNVVTSTTTSVVVTTSTTTIEAPAYSSAPSEQQSSQQPMSSQAQPSTPASVIPMPPNNPPSSMAPPPASSNGPSEMSSAPSSNSPVKSVAPILSGQPQSSDAAPAPASSNGPASSDVPQKPSSVGAPISSHAAPSKGSDVPPPPGSMSSMAAVHSQGPVESIMPGQSSKAPVRSDVPAGSSVTDQSSNAPVQSQAPQSASQPAQSSYAIPRASSAIPSSQGPVDASMPVGQSSANPVVPSNPSQKASSGMVTPSSHPTVSSSQVANIPSQSKAPSASAPYNSAPASSKAPVVASSNAASSDAPPVSAKPSSPASSSAPIAGTPPGSPSSSSSAAPSCTPSFRAYPPNPSTYNDIVCYVQVEAPASMYFRQIPGATTRDACVTACDDDEMCCGGNFNLATNSCSILITTDACLVESRYTLTPNAHTSGFIWVDPSTNPTTTPSLTSTGPTCSPSEVICTSDETTYNQVLCGQELLDASGYSLKPLPISTATTRDACVTACDNNNCCGGNFYSQDNICVLLTATTGYGCPNVNAYTAQVDLEVDSFIWVDHNTNQQDPDTTTTGPSCAPSRKPQARGSGYYNQVLCSQEVVGADYGYTFSWRTISTATSNDACMLACDNNGAQACCAGNFFHANSSCVHLIPTGGYCPALAMYEVEATSTADAFIWVWEDATPTTTTTTSPTSPPTPTCTSGSFDISGDSPSFNQVYCGQSVAPTTGLPSGSYSQSPVYAPSMATCELKCNVMTNCCAGNFNSASQACTLILNNNGDNHHCHQSLFQASVSANTDSFVYYNEDFYY